MPNCEFITFISILACSIAKDKTPEELAFLSAVFVQLRRYFGNTCYSLSIVYFFPRVIDISLSFLFLNIFKSTSSPGFFE